jgi:hypothetical protein
MCLVRKEFFFFLKIYEIREQLFIFKRKISTRKFFFFFIKITINFSNKLYGVSGNMAVSGC